MSWCYRPELSWPAIGILAAMKRPWKGDGVVKDGSLRIRPRALKTEPTPEMSVWQFDSAKDKERDEQDVERAEAMEGRFVGPMPVKAFLDEFLPVADESEECPDTKGAFASLTSFDVESKVRMCDPFIKAVARFAPGMTFFKTHFSPDANAGNLAPEVCGYLNEELPDGPKTDFSKISIFVQFNFSVKDDPFQDDKKSYFELNEESKKKYRGQIGSYVTALSDLQFRIHAFSVSVYGKTARLIRWDRCGAVVSRRFNYITHAHLLAGFFWRYAHLDRCRQGYDPSVSIPSAEEKEVARKAFLAERKLKYLDFRKMMVPDINDPTVEKAFLIPLPLEYQPYPPRSPFSRATRPTVAFDLETGKLVFLKEYWRPDVASGRKESDVYTILHAHGIPHIPPFGTGNDVRNHLTRTQEFADNNWVARRRWVGREKVELVRLRQYRMTLLVIGRSLVDFKSSKEFVNAIADAMKAHDAAYFKANILHRDVSVGNILISDKGGLLIDWDMCLTVEPTQGAPRPTERTGTWHFMSIKMLQEPEHPHDIEDDRESALYVILWTALGFRKYNNSPGSSGLTANDLKLAFTEAHPDDIHRVMRGGTLKSQYLLGKSRLCFDGCPPLDALVDELRGEFGVRYRRPYSRDPEQQARLVECYNNTLKDLRTENWLVNTIEKYLKEDGWPSDDRAEDQDLVEVALRNKRPLDGQDANERLSKKARNT